MPAKKPLRDRFWPKVQKGADPDSCWWWTASKSRGYGYIGSGRKLLLAHRLAYEWLVGPIPDGYQIDHLCRNPACVNPAHMEPVPQRENLIRGIGFAGINARKTHCNRGHEYTEANTYHPPGRPGWRSCRECIRLGSQRVADKRKAAKVG